ncbi:MAG: hypothetical protein HC904_12885 [Blastochloris sp.]|nr:hypothetical protein [Blastochloris sp.]
MTPTPGVEETGEERRLRHQFCRHVYGERYNPETGVVRLAHPYWLREEDQEMRRGYPMSTVFSESNRGWKKGDEMVSLVCLREPNWKPSAKRMLQWKKVHV